MSDIPKTYTDIVPGNPNVQYFDGTLNSITFQSTATGWCSACGIWYWGWQHICYDRHDRQEAESHRFQQGTGDKRDLLWCPGCGKVKRFSPNDE